MRRQRLARGHSLLELSMLSVLFVVLAIVCLDVGFVIMGSQLNDRACRDAARAAAQADNPVTAMNLARAAIEPHLADGYFVTKPQIDVGSFEYEDFAGEPPANTSPYVSVTTTTNVRIPAPVALFGARFAPDGTMEFRRTYTFPIVKTQLYL